MGLKVELKHGNVNFEAFQSIDNIAANTEFGIQKGLWQSGKDLTAIFNKEVLAKNKTGNIYIIRGRRHQASAPGETPANITGRYRKGIGFQVDGSHQLVFGNTEDHALFLELGTSRMRKRPGLSNTINTGQRDIIRNLSTGIFDAI